MVIPDETAGLLDRLAGAPVRKIGRPVSDKIRKIFTPTDITPRTDPSRLRGPWAIIPVPDPPRNTEDYLYRLTVKPDRSWHINVTDLTIGDTRIYSSGTGCAVSMDGQVMTGAELCGE